MYQTGYEWNQTIDGSFIGSATLILPTPDLFDWSIVDQININKFSRRHNFHEMRDIIRKFIRASTIPADDISRLQKLLQILQIIIKHICESQDKLTDVNKKLTDSIGKLQKEVLELKNQKSHSSFFCPLCLKRFKSINSVDRHFLNQHQSMITYWQYLRSPKNQHYFPPQETNVVPFLTSPSDILGMSSPPTSPINNNDTFKLLTQSILSQTNMENQTEVLKDMMTNMNKHFSHNMHQSQKSVRDLEKKIDELQLKLQSSEALTQTFNSLVATLSSNRAQSPPKMNETETSNRWHHHRHHFRHHSEPKSKRHSVSSSQYSSLAKTENPNVISSNLPSQQKILSNKAISTDQISNGSTNFHSSNTKTSPLSSNNVQSQQKRELINSNAFEQNQEIELEKPMKFDIPDQNEILPKAQIRLDHKPITNNMKTQSQKTINPMPSKTKLKYEIDDYNSESVSNDEFDPNSRFVYEELVESESKTNIKSNTNKPRSSRTHVKAIRRKKLDKISKPSCSSPIIAKPQRDLVSESNNPNPSKNTVKIQKISDVNQNDNSLRKNEREIIVCNGSSPKNSRGSIASFASYASNQSRNILLENVSADEPDQNFNENSEPKTTVKLQTFTPEEYVISNKVQVLSSSPIPSSPSTPLRKQQHWGAPQTNNLQKPIQLEFTDVSEESLKSDNILPAYMSSEPSQKTAKKGKSIDFTVVGDIELKNKQKVKEKQNSNPIPKNSEKKIKDIYVFSLSGESDIVIDEKT